jgi:hypothetical protein
MLTLALSFTHSFIHSILGIKLRADNDFYSQIKELKRRNLPLLSSSLATLDRFLPCPRDRYSLTHSLTHSLTYLLICLFTH